MEVEELKGLMELEELWEFEEVDDFWETNGGDGALHTRSSWDIVRACGGNSSSTDCNYEKAEIIFFHLFELDDLVVRGVDWETSTHSTLKIIMFLSLGIPELRKPTDAQKLIGIEKDISNPTLRKRIIISNIPAKICEFMEETNQWFLAGTALRPGSHTRREPAQLNYQIREFQSSKCLITKWKNFFLHSVLGSSTTARYSLLLILTVHFVINACLAYLCWDKQCLSLLKFRNISREA